MTVLARGFNALVILTNCNPAAKPTYCNTSLRRRQEHTTSPFLLDVNHLIFEMVSIYFLKGPLTSIFWDQRHSSEVLHDTLASGDIQNMISPIKKFPVHLQRSRTLNLGICGLGSSMSQYTPLPSNAALCSKSLKVNERLSASGHTRKASGRTGLVSP